MAWVFSCSKVALQFHQLWLLWDQTSIDLYSLVKKTPWVKAFKWYCQLYSFTLAAFHYQWVFLLSSLIQKWLMPLVVLPCGFPCSSLSSCFRLILGEGSFCILWCCSQWAHRSYWLSWLWIHQTQLFSNICCSKLMISVDLFAGSFWWLVCHFGTASTYIWTKWCQTNMVSQDHVASASRNQGQTTPSTSWKSNKLIIKATISSSIRMILSW